MSVLSQSLNLLSSILILLTCPNSDTSLCYSNEPFLTVCVFLCLHAWQVHLLSSSDLTGAQPFLVRPREKKVEYYVDSAHDQFYIFTNAGPEKEYKVSRILASQTGGERVS